MWTLHLVLSLTTTSHPWFDREPFWLHIPFPPHVWDWSPYSWFQLSPVFTACFSHTSVWSCDLSLSLVLICFSCVFAFFCINFGCFSFLIICCLLRPWSVYDSWLFTACLKSVSWNSLQLCSFVWVSLCCLIKPCKWINVCPLTTLHLCNKQFQRGA